MFESGKLILGIVLLMVSGNYLVKGGVGLASHFKVSTLVIGLTVVAFGTSAPELIVSLDAALTGHPEIALGNVIGSNIANIAIVLALTVLILPMPVALQTIKRSWPWMLLSGLVLYLMMANGSIGHVEGFLLVALLVLFVVGAIKSSHKYARGIPVKIPETRYNMGWCIAMVLLASGGLALGSRFLVNSASAIAGQLGVSERIISLTVVAFGTSIPELTASIIAAFKKESDISVGNIIGSNIFNVFAVIGISSGIHIIPLSFPEFRVDLHFMLLFYLILFLFILPKGFFRGKISTGILRERFQQLEGGWISRMEGVVLFFLYLAYLYFILLF